MPAPQTPPTPPRPRRRAWSDAQIAALTEGTMPDNQVQEVMRARDSRGLGPTAYAVLRTARRTEALTPLLGLLDPPGEGEKTKIDLVLDLLERIAEAQLGLARRMDALESAIAGRNAASPTASPSTAARRASAP